MGNRKRLAILLAVAVCCAAIGVAAALAAVNYVYPTVALARSDDNVPVPAAALNDGSRAPTADPSSAAGLADAVNRWAI
jgi:hypothetical protein